MIAGAEASRIGRALVSVDQWASEIIVLINAEVSDATESIARRHGANVFHESWKGHIAQKNSACEKATQPWILAIDCDEEVTPELQQEIARVTCQPAQARVPIAFEFARCTCFFGRWIRHGDWYPDRQTRLWRRGNARWGGIDPHDKLQVDGEVGRLAGELLHHTAESLDQFLQKTQLYAETFARQCKLQGRRVGFCDLLFRPPWRFLRGYGMRLGFLDGWQGLCVAWMGAFYTWLRYAKALEQQRKSGSTPQP